MFNVKCYLFSDFWNLHDELAHINCEKDELFWPFFSTKLRVRSLQPREESWMDKTCKKNKHYKIYNICT